MGVTISIQVYEKIEIFSISKDCKTLKQAAELKHELCACIFIYTLAGYSTAKVRIKMHAPSSCFISAVCFRDFIGSTYLILKISNFLTLFCVPFLFIQSYTVAMHAQ